MLCLCLRHPYPHAAPFPVQEVLPVCFNRLTVHLRCQPRNPIRYLSWMLLQSISGRRLRLYQPYDDVPYVIGASGLLGYQGNAPSNEDRNATPPRVMNP